MISTNNATNQLKGIRSSKDAANARQQTEENGSKAPRTKSIAPQKWQRKTPKISTENQTH
jgi:hypothetical protein